VSVKKKDKRKAEGGFAEAQKEAEALREKKKSKKKH
jgi:hypothetical protein